MIGTLLIGSRPDGEAPRWVRDAWIGTSLPVVEGPVRARVLQVISRRRVRRHGYWVDFHLSVRLLEEVNPPAADWWRNWDGGKSSATQMLFFGGQCGTFTAIEDEATSLLTGSEALSA